MYKEYNDYVLGSLEDVLDQLSIELEDNGLYVNFSNDGKFGGKFYLSIIDKDNVFCKNYPKDDLDWLHGKPIITNFLKRVDDLGIKRNKDYKLYGGGTGVNLVFDKTNFKL